VAYLLGRYFYAFGSVSDQPSWEVLKLSKIPGTTLALTTVVGQALTALSIQGPKISGIAVQFRERWYPQKVGQPVENATPILYGQAAAYILGRHVYTFSAVANEPSWDVLELPEGSHPRPFVDVDRLRIDHGGHIYIFNTGSNKWKDIDTKAILDVPQGKETDRSSK